MTHSVEADSERPRHRRSGGRAARREMRLGAAVAGPPFIRRKTPVHAVLDEEGLIRIEATSDRILAEIGIEFRGDEEALRLWRRAGAEIDGLRVRFPKGLLAEVLATAPSRFTQHARNPANEVEIGGDGVVFAPAYGSPFVMDLDRGRRYGTIADFRDFVRLAQSCPWMHHSGGVVCEPTDIPVSHRHLDMVAAHLTLSDRPFLGAVTSEERAEDSIELARLAFAPGFLDDHCVIMGNVNVNSPLVWDGTMTGALRAYAAAGQGVVCVPFILGGAMGPVTNAGAIAQAHAETLAGCALAQLVRPGAPVIYGNFLSSMALRSGSPTFGTPEPALGSLVVGQLARRAGLPLRCSGSFTTSKLPDAQAMQESTVSMMAAVNCGANFVLHAAGFLDGLLSMSYEKFVLDCDFLGALHSYLGGIDTSDEALALDAFREVGPGSHFFGCAHTMRHYETAFWDSELADNRNWESWDEDGGQDAATRANARWKRLLAEHEAPPIAPGTAEAISDHVARRKAELPERWH